MRLSVAVMAHPKREAFVPSLLDSLDAPATVVWDQKQDRWETGRRSMLSFDPDATHHLVVQDDAIVCRDLVSALTTALDHVPELSPVCLYVGRVRPHARGVSEAARRAKSTGASWLVMTGLCWGVGVVMPTSVIRRMVAECDKLDVANYDSRMSVYFERRGTPVYYTWPSLVEHRDSPSLVPHRAGKRHAHNFIGADASALDIDWSRPAVDVRQSAVTKSVFRCERNGHVVSFPAESNASRRFRAKAGWVEEI